MSTITRGGVTYQAHRVPATAAVLDDTAPSKITVFVFQTDDPQTPQCAQRQATARVVREDAHSVVVAAFAYSPHGSGSGSYACVYALGGGNSAPYQAVALRLKSALGSRELLDAETGDEVGVAGSQDPPAPSYLPAGYQPESFAPFSAGTQFQGLRQYSAWDNRRLTVSVSAHGSAQVGTVVDHAEVAGQPAVIVDHNFQRCLSWNDSRGLLHEVCSLSPTQVFLSTDELVAVARS